MRFSMNLKALLSSQSVPMLPRNAAMFPRKGFVTARYYVPTYKRVTTTCLRNVERATRLAVESVKRLPTKLRNGVSGQGI